MQQSRKVNNIFNLNKVRLVYLGVGLLFLGWILNTPSGLSGKADAIGYAVCHQIASHSFFLGDQPFPLCARCSGMYLGALLGLVYLGITGMRRAGLPSKQILLIFGIFTLIFILDGINSFLSLISVNWQFYQPTNWLRLITGSGMGLTIAAVLFVAFNQTVWKLPDAQPILNGVKLFCILLLLAALMDLLVIFSPWILRYIFAIASVFGVVLLLCIIYTLILIMVLKKENRITEIKQLLPYIAGGFGLAMVQIILLDSVRFLVTGTWEGFYFG